MADFGALPPEINSARMYAGPGPGPLLAAADAWAALAAELDSFAAGYSSTLAELRTQIWSGAAASAMADAAAPFVAWAVNTAGHLANTAAQAHAAAAAYDTAFTATVPPEVVAANRALLAVLITTNFFGQNTAAIAATEAAYAEMWAQDAGAMYGYATFSAAATTLAPFNQPPQTTKPSGQSVLTALDQAATNSADHSVATLSQPMWSMPLTAAALPAASTTTPPTAISIAVAPVAALDYGLNTTILGFEIPKTLFQSGSYFFAAQRTGVQGSDLPLGPPRSPGGTATSQSRVLPAASQPAQASMGRSARVNHLSVPQNWTTSNAATLSASEPVTTIDPARPALPLWTDNRPTISTGVPTAGRIPTGTRGRQTHTVFRRTDRTYRMPRPPLGG